MSIPVPLNEQHFHASGPPPGLRYDECYACFAEQGGLLFRLVCHQPVLTPVPATIQDLARATTTEAASNDAVPRDDGGASTSVWAFYNDTVSTIMKVRCTFKRGSQVQALGQTLMEPCTEAELAVGSTENLPQAAVLDVYPGATELFIAATTLTGFHLSYVTESAPARSVEFIHGTPTVRYDRVYKCFKDNGNGLLFRLVDEANGVWAFYNDTMDYVMRVECVIEAVSQCVVEPLGSTQVAACPREGDDAALFTLFVEPGATRPLLQGLPTFYRLSFSAEPLSTRQSQTPVTFGVPSEDSRLSMSMNSARPQAALQSDKLSPEALSRLHVGETVTRPQPVRAGDPVDAPSETHHAPVDAHTELAMEEREGAQPADVVHSHVDPQVATVPAEVQRDVVTPASPLAPPPASEFINGLPDVEVIPVYHRVFPCFEGHGNGLLFRLVDDVNKIWVFYNDTREYIMEVHVCLTFTPDLLMAPGVRVVDDPTSTDGRVIASVFVPPLATAPFLVGEPAGFELAASALPYTPESAAAIGGAGDEQGRASLTDGSPSSPMSVRTPVTMRGGRSGGGGGYAHDGEAYTEATQGSSVRAPTPPGPLPHAHADYVTTDHGSTASDTPYAMAATMALHDTADVDVPDFGNAPSPAEQHEDGSAQGTGREDDGTGSYMRTPMISVDYEHSPVVASALPEDSMQSIEASPSVAHPVEVPHTLDEGEAVSSPLTALATRTTDHDDAEVSPFLHGRPDARVLPFWDAYYKCFKEHGNGLLFRLVDTHTGTWAFYNDTLDNIMTVHVLFERTADEPPVEPLGDTQQVEDPDLGLVYALEVPPLHTCLFCRSPSTVFTTKFTALLVPPPPEHGDYSAAPVSPSAGEAVSDGETVNVDAPSLTPRSDEARGDMFSDGDAVVSGAEDVYAGGDVSS